MDYRVVLQTFRGSRLIAEEWWSHPLTKREAEKARKSLQPSVTQPLNGDTCVLIVRAC